MLAKVDMPEELSDYDFPDTRPLVNGYDVEYKKFMSDDNFNLLVEEHNKLVAMVQELAHGRND
jgi:hypothetical protein